MMRYRVVSTRRVSRSLVPSRPFESVLDIQTKDSNRFMGALDALVVPHVIEAGDGELIEPIRIADFAFELNARRPSHASGPPQRANSPWLVAMKPARSNAARHGESAAS